MLKSSFFWLKAGILRYFNTENMQNPSKMSKNTEKLIIFYILYIIILIKIIKIIILNQINFQIWIIKILFIIIKYKYLYNVTSPHGGGVILIKRNIQ